MIYWLSRTSYPFWWSYVSFYCSSAMTLGRLQLGHIRPRAQYFGMLVDFTLERVHAARLQDHQIPGNDRQIPASRSFPRQAMAEAFRSHGFI